jgi:hypothetical protein
LAFDFSPPSPLDESEEAEKRGAADDERLEVDERSDGIATPNIDKVFPGPLGFKKQVNVERPLPRRLDVQGYGLPLGIDDLTGSVNNSPRARRAGARSRTGIVPVASAGPSYSTMNSVSAMRYANASRAGGSRSSVPNQCPNDLGVACAGKPCETRKRWKKATSRNFGTPHAMALRTPWRFKSSHPHCRF